MIKIDSKLAKNITNCPACGSVKFKELFKLTKNVHSSAYEIGFDTAPSIVECSDCFLQFKLPVYNTSLDLLVYQQYATGMKKRWNQSLPRDILSLFKDYKKDYFFLEVGPGETPISQICKDGTHFTLDIDKVHIDNNLSKSIIGSIDQPLDNKFNNFFDVVVMFDIAEHVTDVAGMFSNLQKILKPGGELIIETGNALSKHAKREENKWKYYSIPEHRVFFSEEFLIFIAPMFGFKVTQLSKLRHKGVRSASGFLLKLIAFLKWKILRKWLLPKSFIDNSDGIFLTPDSPLIKDHVFTKLIKEKL